MSRSRRSNIPGLDFGTFNLSLSDLHSVSIKLDTDDQNLVPEIIEFLAVVHDVEIQRQPAEQGGYWLKLPNGTPVNYSSLRVAAWLYSVPLRVAGSINS